MEDELGKEYESWLDEVEPTLPQPNPGGLNED